MGLKLNGRYISLILAVQIGKWTAKAHSQRDAPSPEPCMQRGCGTDPARTRTRTPWSSPSCKLASLGGCWKTQRIPSSSSVTFLWSFPWGKSSLRGDAQIPGGSRGLPGSLNPPGAGACPVVMPAALPSCRYWDDFHACTLTALTDCQEGATDLWEKLRRESKNLDFQGSLFELCGGGSGAASSLLPPALPVLLAALWAALVTWLPF
nr:neuritin [Anser cygnoides]